LLFSLFFLSPSCPLRDLLSFPTRRSSDLQAVCVWESGVQQGDQVVFQHGLYFGILLVLPVAGLQHEPGVLFRNISRKCEPVVKADRKSTRLNSSHVSISYAVFCLKKKNKN